MQVMQQWDTTPIFNVLWLDVTVVGFTNNFQNRKKFLLEQVKFACKTCRKHVARDEVVICYYFDPTDFVFSMWPLLLKDGLALPYISSMLLFYVVAYHVFELQKTKPSKQILVKLNKF